MPDFFFFLRYQSMIFGAKTRPKLYDRRELFISWHLVKRGRGKGKGRGRKEGQRERLERHSSQVPFPPSQAPPLTPSTPLNSPLKYKFISGWIHWFGGPKPNPYHCFGDQASLYAFFGDYFVSKAQQWIPVSGSLLGKVSWSISFACLPSPVISDFARLKPPLFVFRRCPSAKLFNLLHPSIAIEKPSLWHLILWVAPFPLY